MMSGLDVIALSYLRDAPPADDNSNLLCTTGWVRAALAEAIAALRANTQIAIVAGAAAGNVTVSGLPASANLVGVVQFPGAGTAVTDAVNLTSQFTVTAAATINNTGGTATTGSKLLVIWN
jgi:hypothetical protein